MVIGPIKHKTNIRFKNIHDFESYINAIDIEYDAEDVIFNGYVYKINTPPFNRVNSYQYGRGTDFRQGILEYKGNNCYIPTSGHFFTNVLITSIKKNKQKNY